MQLIHFALVEIHLQVIEILHFIDLNYFMSDAV